MLIGPVTNVEKKLIGGATISFGYLVDYLRGQNENFTLVNTQRFFNPLKGILNPIFVFVKVLLNVIKADVIFLNSSRGGTKFLAPILYLLAKVFKLKFIFRPFGGNIKDYVSEFNSFHKWIFRKTTLRADLLFLQTHALMDHFSKQNANVRHLPTSRNAPFVKYLRGSQPFQKRFIYLGFINQFKGVDLLLEAAKRLGDETTIHLYGPIKEEAFRGKFSKQKNVYQGVLKKEEVLPTLQNYDVLILPTFYEGEGYPGVIIEAYSLGLPVISTRWKSIPEIVIHQETGLLITPNSGDELIEAIQYFDEKNYLNFSNNARAHFLSSFSTKKVSERVIEQVYSLFKK